jgi:hypothetical protein
MRTWWAPIVVLAAVAVGAGAGVAWERGRHALQSEDIVGAEVTLLQRHVGVPSCAQVRGVGLRGQVTDGDAVVLWRRLPDPRKLQRVVVGPDLATADEEIELDCPGPRP